MNNISDLNIKNFKSINLTLSELKVAFKQTLISKVCGNDTISSHMHMKMDPVVLKTFFHQPITIGDTALRLANFFFLNFFILLESG